MVDDQDSILHELAEKRRVKKETKKQRKADMSENENSLYNITGVRIESICKVSLIVAHILISFELE